MKALRFASSLATFVVLGAVSASGCGGAFGEDPDTKRFNVRLVEGTDVGTREARKSIAVDPPDSYVFSVEVVNRDGTRDTAFDGWLRVAAKPGNITEVTGPEVIGRNIHLKSGLIENVTAYISRAYGDTRIVVEDLGYTPVDANRNPPPQCADGKDNDNDGDIDFPADPECAFANDDSETGGSYATGASDPLFYKLPRAAEVRGAPAGATTPFKSQTVQVDTGYREETRDYDFTMVVTRLSSNGFYVADLEDDKPEAERIGFAGLFAFNFNTPSNLGYCDRLRRLSGTATEFFGSIQLGYPTWSAVRWNGKPEECLIPEPFWFKATDIVGDAISTRLRYTHSLVRVRSGDYEKTVVVDGKETVQQWRSSVRVTKFLGPDHPTQNADESWKLGENATNCDFNGDNTIDFLTEPEKGCAQACTNEPECTEWSNFATRSNFNFIVQDTQLDDGVPTGNTTTSKIQGNGSTSPTFSALALRGQPVHSFSGTLGYFSGGNQFTVEARCSDDIVIEAEREPLPSNSACVIRTDGDNDEEQ